MNMKDDSVFIRHILDCINAVKEFSKGLSKEELITNRLKQSAIVREIEVIGEAVKNISEDLKEKHPEIAWAKIARTRDKMIHHYFGIDLDTVWGIVTEDIPVLEKQIKSIKQQEV